MEVTSEEWNGCLVFKRGKRTGRGAAYYIGKECRSSRLASRIKRSHEWPSTVRISEIKFSKKKKYKCMIPINPKMWHTWQPWFHYPGISLARDAHNVFDESIATAAWKLKKKEIFYGVSDRGRGGWARRRGYLVEQRMGGARRRRSRRRWEAAAVEALKDCASATMPPAPRRT